MGDSHAEYLARVRRRRENEEAQKKSESVEVIGTVADRMRDELVPMFKEPWDARHAVTDFLTGRRLGKSEYLCRLVLRGAWENPRSINPLILPTAKQARYALWPILVRTQRQHFPEARVNESEMRMYLPEGGIVGCGGCEHAEDVVKWFGIPFEEAAIDECGNFKDHLKDLHNDAIRPGTMDFNGRITRSGNPGLLLRGPWFDWTGPSRKATTPLYKGDARMNPYIEKMSGVKPEDFMRTVAEENGWEWIVNDDGTDDIIRSTATFVRLYLGCWAQDSGSLVYPYQAYKKIEVEGVEQEVAWNYAAALPTISSSGDPILESYWRYVIGMDIGFVDDTTYIVLATHPAVKEQYFVHAEGHSQWIDDLKIERAIELRQQFNEARLIIDPGGGGKNVIETLTTPRPGREAIPASVANKVQKALGIRELRDAMIAGNIKFTPEAQPLIDEMMVLGWDKWKQQHDPNGVDHYCDGALYAKRASNHHVFDPTAGKPPPERGTNEWYEQERQKVLGMIQRQGKSSRLNRRGRRGKILVH